MLITGILLFPRDWSCCFFLHPDDIPSSNTECPVLIHPNMQIPPCLSDRQNTVFAQTNCVFTRSPCLVLQHNCVIQRLPQLLSIFRLRFCLLSLGILFTTARHFVQLKVMKRDCGLRGTAGETVVVT